MSESVSRSLIPSHRLASPPHPPPSPSPSPSPSPPLPQDGYLSLSEVIAGAHSLDLNEPDAEELFYQLDLNGDGLVSVNEFTHAASARIAMGESMVMEGHDRHDIVDTVIGGRWRSRVSQVDGEEEIYFDSS